MTKILYKNGNIYTMNMNQPIVHSFMMDDESGKFIWTGNSASDLDADEVRDLNGMTVLPGLIDAHTHMQLSAISSYIYVDCRYPGVTQISDILDRMRNKAHSIPAGNWILGQGVHFQEQKMKEKRYPTKEELDTISSEHPIAFRAGFHITILNTLGLKIAGITKDTPDPPGGIIERGPDGEATGVTIDMHHFLGIPDPPSDERKKAFSECIQNDFLKHGVTSIFEISHTLDSLRDLNELRPPIRMGVYLHVPGTTHIEHVLTRLPEIFTNQNPFFAGMKLFVDGGTTSKAAAFNQPYCNDCSTSGTTAFDAQSLFDTLKLADESGIQVAIHAVGDRAQDITTDAIRQLNEAPNRNQTIKHRIEHGGNILTTPERQRQFKELGIIPVPNPGFLSTFGDSLETYLGKERTDFAYPFNTLIQNQLEPAAGGDCAGTDMRLCNPWFGISCAVNRKTRDGHSFLPHESIDLLNALRMYTIWSAKAGGVIDQVGSIEEGKYADFIVLNENPFTLPSEQLEFVLPSETWIGGQQVY